jgi:hypothetical protein
MDNKIHCVRNIKVTEHVGATPLNPNSSIHYNHEITNQHRTYCFNCLFALFSCSLQREVFRPLSVYWFMSYVNQSSKHWFRTRSVYLVFSIERHGKVLSNFATDYLSPNCKYRPGDEVYQYLFPPKSWKSTWNYTMTASFTILSYWLLTNCLFIWRYKKSLQIMWLNKPGITKFCVSVLDVIANGR